MQILRNFFLKLYLKFLCDKILTLKELPWSAVYPFQASEPPWWLLQEPCTLADLTKLPCFRLKKNFQLEKERCREALPVFK